MTPSGLILGYHGCKADLARRVVVKQASLRPSANGNDWLGQGIDFWAHDLVGAQEWGEAQPDRESITLAVLGGDIDLGRFLNLAQRDAVDRVSEA